MNSLKCAVIFAFLQAAVAIDTSGCGSTKNCLYFPTGCSPTDSTCIFFSYVWDSSTNVFNMELTGSTGNNNQYVGVAFATSTVMRDAELYYCTGADEIKSGTIRDERSPPTPEATLQAGIVHVTAQTLSGVAECVFQRPASITKTISTGADFTFDLETTPFNVLVARGAYTGGALEYHGPAPARESTTNQIDFMADPAATTTAGATTTTTATTTTPTVSSSSDFDEGCGTTKTCFRSPTDCTAGTSGCLFASWIYDAAANNFNFELVGATSGSYVAVAFSDDKLMESDDLYYCTSSALVSGAIQIAQRQPPLLPNQLIGVSEPTNTVDGGVLSCTFKRDASVMKPSASGEKTFNFLTNQYFVLMATGPMDGDNIGYHQTNRYQSDTGLNFTAPPENLGGAGVSTHKRNMVKAHASLMILAWLTCASIGILIARHFKPMWHDSTCFSTKVWFQIHRGLMITAVVATLLAFILIFSSVEGFSSNAGAHPIIGIVVTILAIANPIMALFRPHPGTPRRWIFNWGHWFVGSAARILAITAIFLGVDLTALDLPEWDTWALVGFVCYHVVFEIILEILSAIYGHIDSYKKKKPSDDMPMDDESKENMAPKGATVKYFVLILYSFGNLAFVLAFLAAIGQMD
uniref:Putative ferric-chelate reductase 1 n=1 Tax=Phallusia mammillata TaxID=59560 RepID=A0A6F9DDY5_9ASCI|nr:putative ferric-chelate reductase 1 [Phallusia mammillata]